MLEVFLNLKVRFIIGWDVGVVSGYVLATESRNRYGWYSYLRTNCYETMH